MTEPTTPAGTAPWIDRALYPWDADAFRTPAGTMRYVDAGDGEPVVMIHGNPTWSFTFRTLITGLSDTNRCIAPDLLGFGQSDKPVDWSYTPQDHATMVAMLLDALDLRDVTLVVHDWGGPIGLSWALVHPERVKRLVLCNTWLWSVQDVRYYRMFSGVMGGPAGRALIRHANLFVRGVVPMAYGDRRKLTPAVKHHLRAPFATKDSRKGSWVFPGQIIGSSDWLASRWEQRDRLTGKPALIAWGMKDIAFHADSLERWQTLLPSAEVHRLPTTGHFVQDEAGDELLALVRAFLDANP